MQVRSGNAGLKVACRTPAKIPGQSEMVVTLVSHVGGFPKLDRGGKDGTDVLRS